MKKTLIDLISEYKGTSRNLGSLMSQIKRNYLSELYEATKHIIPDDYFPANINRFRTNVLLYDIKEIPKCPICGKLRAVADDFKSFRNTCGKPKCVQSYLKINPDNNKNYVNYNNRFINLKSIDESIDKFASKGNFGYIFSIINHNKNVEQDLCNKTKFLNDLYESPVNDLRLYCYVNNIKTKDEIPICPICNKFYCKFKNFTLGFLKTCDCKQCRIILQTNNLNKAFENYDFTEAVKKHKETCLKKYGVDSYFKTDEYKTKYFPVVDNYKSKAEDSLYNILLSYFNEDDIIRQYYNKELYPFNCDFYIKSLDLYIEYQGYWTHGDHPYNQYNKNDVKLVNSWYEKSKEFFNNGTPKTKYYTAVECWTIRDPYKREVAKQNNLNLLEIWDLKTAKKYIDDYLNKINITNIEN